MMNYKRLLPAILAVAACATPSQPSKNVNDLCTGSAYCGKATITKIIDGDTLDANAGGEKYRIRLALVNAPEMREKERGTAAKKYLSSICPVGSEALVDQDDRQLRDKYGRMVAVVWCNRKRSNEKMIEDGYASLYRRFCKESEFGAQEWAMRLGCR